MSSDWSVISLREPDQRTVVEALVATMPELNVRETAENSLLELFNDDGEVQLVLELPRLVRVPQEVQRLLAGAEVSAVPGVRVPAVFAPGTGDPAAEPLWWQDIHVRDGVPEATARADALCHALARRCEGAVVVPGMVQP
jgi:hypothetical protein